MEAERVDFQSYQQDWIKAGVILNEHKEHHLAQKVLFRALKQDHINPFAIDQLIYSFQRQGHLEQALKCAKTLVRYFDSAYSQYRLGEVLYLLCQDELALKHFQLAVQALEFDGPMLFEVYKNMGNIFVRQGDFDSAQEYYDKAFTLNSQSDALLVNYGTLEIQRENFDEAKERFRTALQINPQSDRAWVGLALIHRHCGDFEISRANVEKALDIQKNNKTAVKLLVEWSMADGVIDRAIERVGSYLDDDHTDQEMIMIYSQLLWCKGRKAEAELESLHALLLNPQSAQAANYYNVIRNPNV